MTDELKNQGQEFDNRLADFTDQVLAGEKPADFPMGEDTALAGLAKTVLKIKSAVQQDLPDPVVENRVKKLIQKNWQQQKKSALNGASLWQRLLRRRISSRTWFQVAGAVLVLVAVVAILFPDAIKSVPATAAQNAGILSGVVIGLAALLIIILVASNRKW